MESKQQTYLISFALVMMAGIILFDLYKTPELSPAVINKTAGISSENIQSGAVKALPDNTVKSNNSCTASHRRQGSTGPTDTASVININTATAEELMTLKGIGEVKANAIVQYRADNGSFSSIDEILNVDGIGQKTFDEIKSRITV